MNEIAKLMKRFALLSLALLCASALLCGALLVDGNTRQLTFGERQRQVGFSFDRATVTLTIDDAPLPLPGVSLLGYVKYLPAPLGVLAMIIESFGK